MYKSIMWMIGETFVCILLLYYFENVCPTGGGSTQHPLFCLLRRPSEDINKTGESDEAAGNGSGSGVELRGTALDGVRPKTPPGVPPGFVGRVRTRTRTADVEDGVGEPADVEAERRRAEAGGPDIMMRTLKLRKVFPGAKVAVKSLSFTVNRNECFGLLGHNGAGKSTTINMLCGLFGPSSGTAIVDGYRITDEMPQIHKIMGVCPQDNVLWNELTAAEHLKFYARLRAVAPKDLRRAVGTALAAVNLHKWANVQSGRFSGGMKRRLSVACSLVGNPRIIYLDEPSTGYSTICS